MRASEKEKIIQAIEELEVNAERRFMEGEEGDDYSQGAIDAFKQVREMIEGETYRLSGKDSQGEDDDLREVS